jgi:hypothetical protein
MSTVTGGQGNIVTNGLVLNLDTANPRSYPQPYNGTVWSNLVPVSSSISGSLVNGPTYNSNNGGSIVFDGTNDYVYLGTNLDQNGPLTILSWINTTTVSAGARSIISNCNAGGNAQDYILEINRTAGKVGIIWGDTSIRTSTQSLIINQWYQVGFTRLGTTSNWIATIYINGVSDSSTSTAINPNAANVGTSIGRVGDFNGQYFSGKIVNALMYNRALSSQEVLQNFNATRARFGV